MKPSAEVAPGDVVTVAVHGRVQVVKVKEAGSRRGPAAEAALLYEPIPASNAD